MSRNNGIFPENIRKVAIVPIASKAEKSLLSEALEFIGDQGVEVLYPAGKINTPEEKAGYLEDIFKERKVDLIIAERGGYGSAEVCDVLNWEVLKGNSKPLLGYSDITFLHFAMLKFGCGVPIAGPVAVELKKISESHYASLTLFKALAEQRTESMNILDFEINLEKNLKIIKEGVVNAPVIPANLTILTTVTGTRYLPFLSGSVLLLEDVAEPLYKIRRCLNNLRQSDILSEISGLIFGSFSRCGDKHELEKIFEQFAEDVNGPVISNFRFGHCPFSLSIKTGKKILIDTSVFKVKNI